MPLDGAHMTEMIDCKHKIEPDHHSVTVGSYEADPFNDHGIEKLYSIFIRICEGLFVQ